MKRAIELIGLVALFFIYAGDPAPSVNEAHYLVKAKNFWNPAFCDQDLFAASGKAHTTFYWTFGWLTEVTTLPMAAWIGRLIGWTLLAIGLQRLCQRLSLPALASWGVAILWMVGIEYGNLAGEWVVGGIESKVPAYAMVLLALADIGERKWSRAWIWLGAASAFHVLTGGWSVLAAMFAFAFSERLWPQRDIGFTKQPFFTKGLFIGGAISLLGLVPALALTLGADSADSAEAARIYTFVRIRHHLLPADFPTQWFIRHGALVLGLLLLIWFGPKSHGQRTIRLFALAAALIACGGLAIGSLAESYPDLVARLLRYYWFRLTDAAVPLAVAVGIIAWASELFRQPNPTNEDDVAQAAPTRIRWTAWIALGLLLAGSVAFGLSVARSSAYGIPPSTSHRLLGVRRDASIIEQRESHRDWVQVCRWIRWATPEDEVFLTPRHQQTFKWYAHRAEVVNWKDVPQDAESLLEWNRRLEEIYPSRLGKGRVTIRYDQLRIYRQKYGVRFMVVDHRIAGKSLPLVRIYPVGEQSNATYSVYELPLD